MKLEALLNSDMTTIASWLRAGYDWWIGELRAMIPARWQSRPATLARYARFDAVRGLTLIDQGSEAGPVDSQTLPTPAILIPAALGLVRTITLPMLREPDLLKLVMFDAERIMPMPATAMFVALRTVARLPEDRMLRVEVAALPRKTALAAISAAQAAELQPVVIGLADRDASDQIGFDFTPALRAAGLIAAARSTAQIGWAIVAFLFALNLGLLIWRDRESVAQIEAQIALQAPSVNAARLILNRIEKGQNSAQSLIARRAQHDAVSMLGEVALRLPKQAWIQRLQWDGTALRLTGYKRREADVVAAFRASPLLADVRTANSDVSAELPVGQPFDLAARIRGGAQ